MQLSEDRSELQWLEAVLHELSIGHWGIAGGRKSYIPLKPLNPKPSLPLGGWKLQVLGTHAGASAGS